MRQPSENTSSGEIHEGIRAFRRGDPGASDRLMNDLLAPIRRNVVTFLGGDHSDVDDAIQDALLETMKYLERDDEFEGDLIRLAVTIARNRCRDLLRWRQRHRHSDYEGLADWLSDSTSSILEQIEELECHRLLQRALNRLSNSCRNLLTALYVDAVPTDTMRRRLGLGTVHAVYYRRGVCLRRAREYLQDLLSGRSIGESIVGTDMQGDDGHD